MKNKNLKKKLVITADTLSKLEKETIKGGSCYNTTSVIKIHSYCVPAT